YLTDFEPVQRLARGGLGVVCQVRNKLDENEYAVKRINLPTNKSSAERVKREARALAKLNHANIVVRCYNSWPETPPQDGRTPKTPCIASKSPVFVYTSCCSCPAWQYPRLPSVVTLQQMHNQQLIPAGHGLASSGPQSSTSATPLTHRPAVAALHFITGVQRVWARRGDAACRCGHTHTQSRPALCCCSSTS
ncbi:hypothetical protein O3P69_010950, partial [Scylla paramamosain]